MIVRMNLKTREQTIIEPVNDADREVFKKIWIQLYYNHERLMKEGLQCRNPG